MKLFTDMLERTVSTYIQGFLGLLLADTAGMFSVGVLEAAALAAVPAALAVVKAWLGSYIGNPLSAAWLKARYDD